MLLFNKYSKALNVDGLMWIPTGVLEGNLKSNSSVTIKAVSVAHTIRTVSRLPKK